MHDEDTRVFTDTVEVRNKANNIFKTKKAKTAVEHARTQEPNAHIATKNVQTHKHRGKKSADVRSHIGFHGKSAGRQVLDRVWTTSHSCEQVI